MPTLTSNPSVLSLYNPSSEWTASGGVGYHKLKIITDIGSGNWIIPTTYQGSTDYFSTHPMYERLKILNCAPRLFHIKAAQVYAKIEELCIDRWLDLHIEPTVVFPGSDVTLHSNTEGIFHLT